MLAAWRSRRESSGSSSSSSTTWLPSEVSRGEELVPVERLHILPLAEADRKLAGRSRLDFLAPELRRMRSSRQVVKAGDLVRHEGLDFVIVKCYPPEGILGNDTSYHIDGSPVVCFEKIEFSVWGPEDTPSKVLSSKYIAAICRGDRESWWSTTAKRVRLLFASQILQNGNVHLQVDCTEPSGLGIVTEQTEIVAKWDAMPEFTSIRIVAFRDTLPRVYKFDLFKDYLKPYLQAHTDSKFSCGDLFTFHGVQFQVASCEPDVRARVGMSTSIFCTDVIQQPKMPLLASDWAFPWDMLEASVGLLGGETDPWRQHESAQRLGLFEETIAQIEVFEWPPSGAESALQDACIQGTCMICLSDFEAADKCHRLPCRHVFHKDCVEDWLRRCTDCPICKANVDRAIRNY